MLKKTLFSRCGVHFGEKKEGNTFFQKIKMSIRPYIPKSIFNTYKSKKDTTCFYPVSKKLFDTLRNTDGVDIWNDNSVIAHWYMESVIE
jgi:hypothetical protein